MCRPDPCKTSHFSIKSLLREIETLETQLNLCEDEDEQRALEEDLTGKVTPVIRNAGSCDNHGM